MHKLAYIPSKISKQICKKTQEESSTNLQLNSMCIKKKARNDSSTYDMRLPNNLYSFFQGNKVNKIYNLKLTCPLY